MRDEKERAGNHQLDSRAKKRKGRQRTLRTSWRASSTERAPPLGASTSAASTFSTTGSDPASAIERGSTVSFEQGRNEEGERALDGQRGRLG